MIVATSGATMSAKRRLENGAAHDPKGLRTAGSSDQWSSTLTR